VFDIRQGVAIAFFVKRGGKSKSDAVVRHAELYGTREAKHEWLEAHEHKSTEWRDLTPRSPFYQFVPRDDRLEAEYRLFPGVPDIFPVNSVGIVTARDNLTIQWSAQDAWRTVTVFAKLDPELARQAYDLGKDARDWKVVLAQQDLRDSGPVRDKIVPILYRPFDVRYTYYTGRSRGFICMPRPEVMRHMMAGENVALMTCRQLCQSGWFHAFASSRITDDCMVSNRTRERGYLFPLYLYPSAGRGDFFAHLEPSERQPNLNPKLVAALAAAYGREPSPEEVFHYVYAVLYAPTYREKYAEFLRMDFPRIPFTADAELFRQLAALGERLVALHLLKSAELDPPMARFQGEGDGKVIVSGKQGLRYEAGERRVYINPNQYFEGVPPEVWAYQIGGYQVCHKWLKDRKDRRLSLDEIRTYCRITTALAKTIEIQTAIDELYPAVEAKTVYTENKTDQRKA
ncbi:MAG: type ISP restriction/modification enzyme, partial [Candidatus Bipolaricaulaceae bacterium]